MKKNTLIEEIAENYPDALLMTGYDCCILGVCHRFGQDDIVAYDLEKVLNKLMKDGMTYEEAQEWWEFNMVGSYAGDNTPCFIDRREM